MTRSSKYALLSVVTVSGYQFGRLLGGMLTAAAQGYVTKAPWAGIFPGLAIFTAVQGFNLHGDALRDSLAPRLWGVGATAQLLSRG